MIRELTEELDLSTLKSGDVLIIEGDDTHIRFECARNTPTGPVGLLQDLHEDDISAVQLLGMIAFTHNQSGVFQTLEPNVLKTEYGYLAILVSEGRGSTDFIIRACSFYDIIEYLVTE